MAFADQEARELCKKLVSQGKDIQEIVNTLGNRATKDDIYQMRHYMLNKAGPAGRYENRSKRRKSIRVTGEVSGIPLPIPPGPSPISFTKEELIQVHQALQIAADLTLRKLVALIKG